MRYFTSLRKQFFALHSTRWLAIIGMFFFAFAGSVAAGHTNHMMNLEEHESMGALTVGRSCTTSFLMTSRINTSCIKNQAQQHDEHSPLWCTIECLESSIAIPSATTFTRAFSTLLFAIIPLLVISFFPTRNIHSFVLARVEPPPQRSLFLSLLKRE